MTIAAMPPEAAPARPIPTTRPGVPAPPVAVPETAATVSDTPRRTRADTTLRLVTSVALAGGAILAGIGFAGSYKALQALGEAKGLGRFSYVFPIGLDAGIVVLLALDLLLIRRRTPWPALRWLAHAFTAGTVVFNASSGGPIREDPVGAALHGVIPLMFIAAVEAGRRLVIKLTKLEDGHQGDGVPLYRWVLAPRTTAALWRRMRLWGISSYREAVDREQELTVYRVMLEREYGSVRKAPSDARLPLTMAPYGLTVDEALALPRRQAEREKALKAAQQAAEEAARQEAEERRAQAQIAALRRQSAIQAAQAEAEAAARAAEAQAQAQVTAAERLAQLEEQAVETATIAEAKAKAAAAARQEAEERRAQAAAEAEAAELERQAAQARAEAAEAEKAAEAEARAVETQAAAEARRRAAEEEEAAAEIERRAAETRRAAAEMAAREARAAEEAERARLAAAEANRRAAEMEEAAAEARRRAAEMELRAVEMEDAAQLKPSERAARRVARLALAEAGGRAEALPLERIVEVLGVSTSTASERRREAAELLAAGYRPSVD